MKKTERIYLNKIYQQIDLLIMSACCLTALGLSKGTDLFFQQVTHIFQTDIRITDLLVFILLLIIWHHVFVLFGFYRNRSLTTFRNDVFEIIKANAVCVMFFYIVTILFKLCPNSIIYSTLFWIFASIVFIIKQISFNHLIRFVRLKNRNIRFILIVGTNKRSYEHAKTILEHPELGYKCLGFCDDEWHSPSFIYPKQELVCSLNNIKEYLRHNVVDEVLITLPIGSFYRQINQINLICEEQGIKIRLGINFFSFNKYQTSSEEIVDNVTILHHGDRMAGPKALLKRILDFSGSLIGIIVLSPVLIITALLVKFSSPGPAFFKQKRLGRNKRVFTMYKFRTMVQDAEALQTGLESKNEASGAVFKIANDPRITPIGKFLRKTSIDELPQLFNVFRGDMSLIGPRPLPLRDYSRFENDSFRRRMSVLPGITCIWQANGRSNVSFDEWMRMDLEYVDTWSMRKDFSILFQTFISVLKGTGAV